MKYDELHDKMIHLTFEREDMDHRLMQAERKIEQLTKRRSPAVPAKKAPTSVKKKRTTKSRSTLPRDARHLAFVRSNTQHFRNNRSEGNQGRASVERAWLLEGAWRGRQGST